MKNIFISWYKLPINYREWSIKRSGGVRLMHDGVSIGDYIAYNICIGKRLILMGKFVDKDFDKYKWMDNNGK